MIENVCKLITERGGKIVPLIVPFELAKGTGQMNPSILIKDGRILMNLRGVQYLILHSENQQKFPSRWGPLAYMNPESDMHLRTTNFFIEVSPDTLEPIRISQVDTSKLDVEPLWEFVGLEDVRLTFWDNKYWYCGVRRDTTTIGEGRIEMSEVKITPDTVIEVNRYRIDPPKPSYCEKNWMPIMDKPFQFVKWTNPTEVVEVNVDSQLAVTIHLSDTTIPNLPDLRGGSSVIRFKDNYIAIVHEVRLFKNELKQKDAFYFHRFVVWDDNWNLVRVTEPFNFMDARIEFCCGLGILEDKAYISFGFQDNAAYLMQLPLNVLEDLIWKD